MSYIYVFSTPESVVRDVIIATPDIIQNFLATDPVYGAVLTPRVTPGRVPAPRPNQARVTESVRAFANGERELRATLPEGPIRGARVDMTHFRDLRGPTRQAIGEMSAQRNLPVEVQQNIRRMVGVARRRKTQRRRK